MLAYSYIRFSTAKQLHGDSLRRQTELADRYANRHNLVLDNTTYQDHGVSAFKGKNVIEGKLGTFLNAIDEGVIHTPCYLLIEALDRLTRKEIVSATQLFLSIIQRGVTIVTLQNEQIFSEETASEDNGISIIVAISILIQGHNDSAKRSERIFAAWENKRKLQRETGIITTKKCPAWLDIVDGKFVIDEIKAATLRYIYQLALDGNGCHTIAKMLNFERIDMFQGRRTRLSNGDWGPPSNIWTSGNISGLLSSVAVFGRWKRAKTKGISEDEYIDDYYPVVVSKDIFDLVRTVRSKIRGSVGGFKQGTTNLFSGISKCIYCGTSMKITGNAAKGENLKLRCNRSTVSEKCQAKNIPYAALESDVLSYLMMWQRRDLHPTEIARNNKSAQRNLEQTLLAREHELEQLISVITLTKTPPDILAKKIDAIQADINRMKTEIQGLSKTTISDNDLKNSADLFEQLMDGGVVELRKKVQMALRRQINKIEIGDRVFRITYLDGSVATSDFHYSAK